MAYRIDLKLFDELFAPNSTPATVIVEDYEECPQLERLKSALQGRPPIPDADTRAVYEYFRNWSKEFGDFAIHYGAFEEVPSLPVRMQRGRHAGEPITEGSAELWEIEQPPITISATRINKAIKWLEFNGYILHEIERNSRGKIIEHFYSVILEEDAEYLLGLGYVFGKPIKRGMY